MARAKRWSGVLASTSLLLLAVAAHAESPRPVELPAAVPVDIVLPGLEQAVAVDPSVVRADADLDRGVLTLTGLAMARQSVVYAWTAGGVVTFIARVVAPPVTITPPRPISLTGEGSGSLYRFSVGSGFRRNADGMHKLPFTFGTMGAKAVGGDRLTFRGDSRPFGDPTTAQDPTASGGLAWNGDRYRVGAGDQPVELSPSLLTTFPLRGVTGDYRFGPVSVGAFGGPRATSAFALIPEDRDAMPAWMGGLRAAWTLTDEIKVAGLAALAGRDPIASLNAEWRRGVWSAILEGAGTTERLAAGLRLRRATDTLTVEQRLTERTPGTSALLSGADGITSETGAVYRFTKTVSANARVTVMPGIAFDQAVGGWHVGGDWAPRDGLHLALGLDRSFDGASTGIGGTVDVQSATFGAATVTVMRMAQESGGVTSTAWYEGARVEKPLEWKPLTKAFVEQTLTQSDVQGRLEMFAGGEVEKGWIRASLAPGFIVPTLTDPNGVAQTLRLRVTATPSAAFQVQAEVRQIFGAKPDTTVQVGVGVGFGSGTPWPSVPSWLGGGSTLEGVVFLDRNGNGAQDPGEPGLPNVRIVLDGERSETTDGEGRFRFTGVKRGTYHVSVDRTNLSANLRLASASPLAVRVPEGPRRIAFAFAGSGAIQGVVFNDLSLGRRFSGTEPGIMATVTVEGPGTRRTLGVNGTFSLGGLAPGHYRISVDALSLPPSFVLDTSSIEVDLAAGDVATAQFPAVALRALAVTACFGGATRATCAEQDRVVAGLRVTVGTSEVVTDEHGQALLRQLPAGRLTVSVVPASVPAGWAAPVPVTVDLPEAPTSLPVSIRLVPTRH